ncbi:alpha-glucosidase [Motilibacter rhizosphaerae]|uniref:Alpha-glucosidase n=1 Tax=Motilibacter rhizosphaerae TaxID=598652 RepID=A0A4Q7NV93_9ACTN|nr:glycoside hydrolase family 13 protein [Motilibacter rhizosphaerae]RZS90332.1 alpha-glucosidase [Motilibacter rhizosphaerae]
MNHPTTAPTSWWRDAVIYQVYVRSFADADGDGIGDLAGLRARLDHVARLGVDGIWLNPHYSSPQRDHGYDIADYFAVEPAYGDLDSFDALVADAHERGLKVLLDVVANHCSSDHPWFQEALAAAPGSPERARFVFRDGRGAGGELPPNNWQSIFGGPAWTRVPGPDGTPGQWYLHIFDSSQPDFDWRAPEVPAMFDEVLRFWFDRGIDGFRIDVGHGLYKHPELPDWPCAEDGHDCDPHDYNGHMWNQAEVHEVYRSWRALADSYSPDRELMYVGEVWVPQVDSLADYLRPDELHQAFFFDLLLQPWDGQAFRGAITRGVEQAAATGAPVTWTLSNHDVPRTVTRYGITRDPAATTSQADPIKAARARGAVDVEKGSARARAAVLLQLALPGAVYLYAGEELGLPEVTDLPDEARQDPAFFRTGGEEVGRDGCRVPLPWTEDRPGFGFSLAGGADGPAEPWLPQPDWFGKYAVSALEEDRSSVLHLYRDALAQRRGLFAAAEPLVWLETGSPDVLAFERGAARCVVNTGSAPYVLPEGLGDVVLASAGLSGRELPVDAAVWLR